MSLQLDCSGLLDCSGVVVSFSVTLTMTVITHRSDANAYNQTYQWIMWSCRPTANAQWAAIHHELLISSSSLSVCEAGLHPVSQGNRNLNKVSKLMIILLSILILQAIESFYVSDLEAPGSPVVVNMINLLTIKST